MNLNVDPGVQYSVRNNAAMNTWTGVFAALFSLALLVTACEAGGAPLVSDAETTPSSAVNQRRNTTGMRAGALVSDEGPPVLSPRWPTGLWLVSPDGEVEPIVDRRWRPITQSPRGLVAATHRWKRGEDLHTYGIVQAHRTETLGNAAVEIPCATWSSDDRLLAYLTGPLHAYDRLTDGPSRVTAVATAGELRITQVASGTTTVVSRGLFPECPLWSPTGRSLAYLERAGRAPATWRLKVLTGNHSQTVGTFRTPSPSLSGPKLNWTFDWSPSGELVFLKDRSLFRFRSGRAVERLGTRNALRAIEAMAGDYGTYQRLCRFSPDGSLMAVAIGGAVGIFHADGRLVDVVQGLFRGWAGNSGVLTVQVVRRLPPSLFLHPASRGSARQLIDKGHKVAVITDPAGEWFAYPDSEGEHSLVFRRPDGSVLGRVSLPFRPGLVEAFSSDGRRSQPTWP